MCHRSSILLLLSSLLNFGVLIKTASFTTSTDNSVQNVLPSKILIADHERKLCVTKTCNETSKELLNSIDETINPCDNFYQFACGNFLKTTVLPNDTKQLISFKFLQNRIENRLYNHFSEESLPNDTNAIKQTKLFYKSCMDQTSSDVRGTRPLVELIESYGGWPVVKGDEWNTQNIDWIELIGKISNDGINTKSIVSISVIQDFKNSSKHILMFDIPSFGLRRELLLGPRKHNYYNYMVETAIFFGANRTSAQKEMMQVIDFEIALAKATLWNSRLSFSEVYNLLTIDEMQIKYPYINWLKMIRSILSSEVSIDGNEPIAVGFLGYFERLGGIVRDVSNRTMVNYLIVRSVLFSTEFLNTEMRQRSFNYSAIYYGTPGQIDRHIECISYTEEFLPVSVGAMYVRKNFNEASKRAADNLVEDVKNSFVHLLREAFWMDNMTRNVAIEKAEAMKSSVAYPYDSNDEHDLVKYHKDLELEPDNFFANVLRVIKFKKLKNHRALHRPVHAENAANWKLRAYTISVSAFSIRNENRFYLPSAILQRPFFDADQPSYLNYGGIGQIIGHEVTHNFDDGGRQFDLNGNLIDWWQKDSQKTFSSKADCFIQQWFSYLDQVDPGRTQLVRDTLSENLADNGGLKAAYMAYQRFVERNGPEPLLPELQYTQKQLFWISAAQVWCSVVQPAYARTMLSTDTHPPHSYRVTNPLTNIAQFSEDFQCSVGTKMNPFLKCKVW